MAERPIKKSERLAAAQSSEGEAVSEEKQAREVRPTAKGKGQKKGKGRDRQRDEKPSSPVNPALMRGPKPVPPPPPKEEEPDADTEATDAATDEATEDGAPSEET